MRREEDKEQDKMISETCQIWWRLCDTSMMKVLALETKEMARQRGRDNVGVDDNDERMLMWWIT